MNRRVSLMQAAKELRLPYHTTLRLVLTGRLEGDRIEGHWFVSEDSLEQFARTRVDRWSGRE